MMIIVTVHGGEEFLHVLEGEGMRTKRCTAKGLTSSPV